jgi:hypothetical protein
VANGKKVFVKSPDRIWSYKNKVLYTLFHPALVITCYGIWVDAIMCHAEIVELIYSVVN